MSLQQGTVIRIGTRGSQLALWQAHFVSDALREIGAEVELITMKTQGDTIQDVPLAKIGDKGLFTKELDHAILNGDVHLAVHSLKDLPTKLPEGLRIAAITERAEPWDAFITGPEFSGKLTDLPEGATLATSSLRREAQLRAWRPDLNIQPVRGNVDTRLAKLDRSEWHGMILAAAGLRRLGFDERIAEIIPPEVMLPAVGQGALGIVCAAGDEATSSLLFRRLNHEASERAALAERAFLRRLEGGCQVPIGAWGRIEAGRLRLDGCIASVDGASSVRARLAGMAEDSEGLGTLLAEQLLARGGDAILQSIRTLS